MGPVHGSLSFLLVAALLVSGGISHPRHKTRVGSVNDWGLGMDQSQSFLNVNNKQPNVQNMLKEHDSPAIRALMNDPLFLRHLELFLEKPNQKTFHELKSRAKTLRRRRTDEVSSRFFLRD